MRQSRVRLLLLALLLPAPALAADDPAPRVVVSATGTATTPPDRASIDFTVHGEGTTSDEAVAAMAAKRKAIGVGLASYSRTAQLGTSQVSVAEVRGPTCNRNNFGNLHLSTGECAIIGYTADQTVNVRTDDVRASGTIVGLLGRLGATNPRLSGFALSDEPAAQRRATAVALANARRQAESIAQAAGVRLGALLSASNGNYGAVQFRDTFVSGASLASSPAPPPPPPVGVDLTPRPIETQASVTVAYAITP